MLLKFWLSASLLCVSFSAFGRGLSGADSYDDRELFLNGGVFLGVCHPMLDTPCTIAIETGSKAYDNIRLFQRFSNGSTKLLRSFKAHEIKEFTFTPTEQGYYNLVVLVYKAGAITAIDGQILEVTTRDPFAAALDFEGTVTISNGGSTMGEYTPPEPDY